MYKINAKQKNVDTKGKEGGQNMKGFYAYQVTIAYTHFLKFECFRRNTKENT